MNHTADRPWTALYPDGVEPLVEPAAQTINEAWAQRVSADPDATAVTYFDQSLSASDVDALADALAVELQQRGVGPGTAVGIYLQNIPQFALSLLAIWKAGGTALVLNPMYKGKELRAIIDDSGAVGIVCLDSALDGVTETLRGSRVAWAVTTSDRDFQSEDDPRVFSGTGTPERTEDDLLAIVRRRAGQVPAAPPLTGESVALLTYTSGTTGPAKGALGTHRNVLNVATGYARWQQLAPADVVLAVAPLFHITGAVATAVTSLIHPVNLVFINRVRPDVVLEAFSRHRVTHVIGSITVFNALLDLPHATAADFATLKYIYSGGAPIPPATVATFQARFGQYIHNVYGMTETASAVIAVPPGAVAPVDPGSGTLAIGVPLPNLVARVVGLDGTPVPAGEPGELELSGPQVTPGYLNKPAETAAALPGGRLRTGDVAIMDAAGWIYLVDRMKDQINVSGYKVWPREVEDALYEHPAVLEAAVVGQPDSYSGESVVAYVSLKAGAQATDAELVAFAKERMAAYKYPRRLYILNDLPKTHTGKIQRRELRGLNLKD
ncbi:class I adenylate-forming enzyme family protein [Arthrobacter sp. EPSL27]|uniref:class I adenylate-forming enzyme family protein n=1 Tax=Arthrobacter sp. EPSL27 TaxID=1745378 RepID=UPI00074B2801|nr:AMP-binding protein [Arthrobacter sp. EPSL27]KUM37052.1 acyl-CoA synthetase [Arthrobacter sp. EPSL27]